MFQSIVHLFLNTAETHPDKQALLFKQNGVYREITYRAFQKDVEHLMLGMLEIGLQPGDRVAILSYNRPEWPITDLAVFALRGVTVPIYHTLPPEQIQYILKDAGVRAVFVENREQLAKILAIRSNCPDLEFIFSFDPVMEPHSQIRLWRELKERGIDSCDKKVDRFRSSLNQIDPGELCSLVYTSGTTGNPKGVMLHHRGFVADVINSEKVFNLYPEDVFLSFLPLSHLYERLAGHWCAIYRGAAIGYASGIDTVVEDILKIRPTVIVSVPRLYEKISSAVVEQVESGPAFKQRLFYWALKTGREFAQCRRESACSILLKFKHRLAERLVFKKIKAKLGGRLRFPISGGAPLSTDTLKFFEAIGIQIVEGYGMTETHLIISLTPPGSTKYGSCGQPIPGVEVKIADDGEILVRGYTLMAGYYRQPNLTAEIIDADGWLHTGDIGRLDGDNYLFITDRKKNILVTAGGKNVAPAPIENRLKQSKYIDDVCLIGDRRKFVSAIIVPNFESLSAWAEAKGIPLEEEGKLICSQAVHDLVMEEATRLQSVFARYEKAKKILVLARPLSIENGHLTPSLKIKRKSVEAWLKTEIDALYSD